MKAVPFVINDNEQTRAFLAVTMILLLRAGGKQKFTYDEIDSTLRNWGIVIPENDGKSVTLQMAAITKETPAL